MENEGAVRMKTEQKTSIPDFKTDLLQSFGEIDLKGECLWTQIFGLSENMKEYIEKLELELLTKLTSERMPVFKINWGSFRDQRNLPELVDPDCPSLGGGKQTRTSIKYIRRICLNAIRLAASDLNWQQISSNQSLRFELVHGSESIIDVHKTLEYQKSVHHDELIKSELVAHLRQETKGINLRASV